MNENEGKRMVADTGYAVTQAVQIGDREIVLAENMNEPEGLHYFLGNYNSNGMVGEYSQCIYGADYLGIMQEFTFRINNQVEALRKEFSVAGYQAEPVTADQCYRNDYSQSIVGEVVAIKATALRPEYRRGDVQLVYVTHGNGAKANPMGQGVYCFHLNDGKQTRFNRQDVQGKIKDLPTWAKERLAAVKEQAEQKKSPNREAR